MICFSELYWAVLHDATTCVPNKNTLQQQI